MYGSVDRYTLPGQLRLCETHAMNC